MTQKDLLLSTPDAEGEQRLSEILQQLVHRAFLPGILFAALIVLTYGYEVFNFNLSLDETLAGTTTTRNWNSAWLGQGRWFTGLIGLVLPNAIGPAVATGLGVALSAAAWWSLCRYLLHLAPWYAALASALAVTMPVVALGFTFATFALALGVGQVLVVACLDALKNGSQKSIVAAILYATLACGTYESFAISILMGIFVLGIIYPSWRFIVMGITILCVSAISTRVIGWALRNFLHVPSSSYTSGFLNLRGFASDPFGSFANGLRETVDQLLLARSIYQISAPWVPLLFGILIVLAMLGYMLENLPLERRITNILIVAAIYFTVVGSAALLKEPPLRSLLYLPFCWIVLVVGASKFLAPHTFIQRRGNATAAVIATIASFTVFSQAIVDNRIFAAGAVTLAHDRSLAYEIERQSFALATGPRPVPVFIWATDFSWPESTLSPPVENEGVSLFDGETSRGTSFLNSQGIAVKPTSESQARLAKRLLVAMPTYPSPGWIKFDNGILLVKLTENTD